MYMTKNILNSQLFNTDQLLCKPAPLHPRSPWASADCQGSVGNSMAAGTIWQINHKVRSHVSAMLIDQYTK